MEIAAGAGALQGEESIGEEEPDSGSSRLRLPEADDGYHDLLTPLAESGAEYPVIRCHRSPLPTSWG